MVAGIGTILIPPGTGDMDVYIEQLQRLQELKPHLMFPSHGLSFLFQTKHSPTTSSIEWSDINVFSMQLNRGFQRYLKSLQAYANTPDAHPGLAQDQTLAHFFHTNVLDGEQTNHGWIRGDD